MIWVQFEAFDFWGHRISVFCRFFHQIVDFFPINLVRKCWTHNLRIKPRHRIKLVFFYQALWKKWIRWKCYCKIKANIVLVFYCWPWVPNPQDFRSFQWVLPSSDLAPVPLAIFPASSSDPSLRFPTFWGLVSLDLQPSTQSSGPQS